jgi:hypothetical protein
MADARFQVPKNQNVIVTDERQSQFHGTWLIFFNRIWSKFSWAESIAAISAPDASDLATAITLANETKTQVNALIAALKK